MSKFGEISWEDEAAGGQKKRTNSKDLFLRLDDGTNEVRLVTQPYQYLTHKYKKDGDPGFGQKVNCCAANASCPLCAAGDKPKQRWLLGVISRKTGTYKVLDISYAVFSQIRKLAQNTARFGDPTKYDVDIFVDRNGGAAGYYSVQALPKEPLSAADQEIKDKVDFDDLKRRVTPPDLEFVKRQMDRINGVVSDKPSASSQSKPVVSQVDNSPSDEGDDDDDAFPSYE